MYLLCIMLSALDEKEGLAQNPRTRVGPDEWTAARCTSAAFG